MFKDVCGGELSKTEEKVVMKHFSESMTEDMNTYIQAPMKYQYQAYLFNGTIQMTKIIK